MKPCAALIMAGAKGGVTLSDAEHAPYVALGLAALAHGFNLFDNDLSSGQAILGEAGVQFFRSRHLPTRAISRRRLAQMLAEAGAELRRRSAADASGARLDLLVGVLQHLAGGAQARARGYSRRARTSGATPRASSTAATSSCSTLRLQSSTRRSATTRPAGANATCACR